MPLRFKSSPDDGQRDFTLLARVIFITIVIKLINDFFFGVGCEGRLTSRHITAVVNMKPRVPFFNSKSFHLLEARFPLKTITV